MTGSLQEGQGAFAAGHQQSEAEHLHQVLPVLYFITRSHTFYILSPGLTSFTFYHQVLPVINTFFLLSEYLHHRYHIHQP